MRGSMKRATLLFLMVFALLAFVGVALAAEMSGEVTAVDPVKGHLTFKTGSIETAFDCENNSIIKDVKVGDMVTVQYTEVGGKKKATSVTPMKKKSSGY